jgi:hypothetical protein
MRTAALALALGFAAPGARAGTLTFNHHVPETQRHLEIALVGLTRDAVRIKADDTTALAFSGTGAAAEIKLAARVRPWLAIGAFAEAGGFTRDATTPLTLGVAAGLLVTVHVLPWYGQDPWIEVEVGTAHARASVQLGIDYRTSANFAIAPVLGASYADDRHGEPHSWLLFGGLQCRFDLR